MLMYVGLRLYISEISTNMHLTSHTVAIRWNIYIFYFIIRQYNTLQIEVPSPLLNTLYLFCLVWSVGGYISSEGEKFELSAEAAESRASGED